METPLRPPAGLRIACTTADHEAMKRDWRWEFLVPIGVQHIDADGDEPAITLDLRNCWCGSTLAKEVC